MNFIKKCISLISSFILVLSVGILISNNLVKAKLLDKEYVIGKMNESEFYEQISREIQNSFDKYSSQSGLPDDMLKDLFTDAMVKRDVTSIINCVYEGTQITVSDDAIRTELDDRINEYIESKDMLLTLDGKNNIDDFKDIIVNLVKSKLLYLVFQI
jgi:hypothetical protein